MGRLVPYHSLQCPANSFESAFTQLHSESSVCDVSGGLVEWKSDGTFVCHPKPEDHPGLVAGKTLRLAIDGVGTVFRTVGDATYTISNRVWVYFTWTVSRIDHVLSGLFNFILPAQAKSLPQQREGESGSTIRNADFTDIEVSATPEDTDSVTRAVSEIYHTNLHGIEITQLSGGHSGDHLYKVAKGESISVIRVYASDTDLERRKEGCFCAKIASDLGIAPRVLYASENFDVIVMNFVKGSKPDITTFTAEIVKTLAANFKKLHNGPASDSHQDIFQAVRHYASKIPDHEDTLELERLKLIEEAMKTANFPRKLCHYDIWTDNLFVCGKELYFIDWSEAGMGDPYYDLAKAGLELGFDSTQDEELLSDYCENVTDLERSRFFLMKQVSLLWWAFWAASQSEGPNNLPVVLRRFEVHGYALPSDVVTYKDISRHVFKLFLKNTAGTDFDRSLKMIQKARKPDQV